MQENPYEPPQDEPKPGDPELRQHLAAMRVVFWLSLAIAPFCFLVIEGTAGNVFGCVFVAFAIAASGCARWLKGLN